MKRTVVFALIIGGLTSAALLAMDQVSVGNDVMDWEMPGIAAAYLFWGAVGGSVVAGVAICWFVNAIVFSVPAFVVVTMLRLLRRQIPSLRVDKAS